MKQLKAGDVRQEGDEYRWHDLGHDTDWRNPKPPPNRPGQWNKVTHLQGFSILASDLMLHEFRRP
jgi:hypothetical protein